jgi:DNA adenine methylase
MVGYVADVLIHNQLRPDLFVELFAGGSSVSIQLLHDGLVESIGLVDLDRRIAAFWATVFHDSGWLLDQIADIPLDLDHWRAFRAVQNGSRRELALACLYLNRTSFSGILADRAGPLGGTKVFDAEKFGCRFARETLARRVRHLATHRDKVKFIWSRDWSAAVRELHAKRRTGSLDGQLFYFVDPPFFHKAERLYRHSFRTRQHRSLRDALVNMSRDSEPWLLSYDSLPEVEALYGASASIVTIDRFYTTSRLVSKQPMFAEAVVTNLATLPAPRRLQVGTHGGSGVIEDFRFATLPNDPTATEGSRP